MKYNNALILLLLLIVLLLISSLLFFVITNDGNAEDSIQSPSADALRFKEEYERYNGTLSDNGDFLIELYIPENNRVEYASLGRLIDRIDSGTGVFFFSSPTCPWSRQVLPTLLEAVDYQGVGALYYHIDSDRDSRNQNYLLILDRLHDYLPTDERNQSPGEDGFNPEMKQVATPHIFIVRDGVIVSESMMNGHHLLVDNDLDRVRAHFLHMFRALEGSTCC